MTHPQPNRNDLPVAAFGQYPFGVQITAGELAKLLGVSERTLRRWAADGLMPAPVRAGGSGHGQPIWDSEEVDAFLASRPWPKPGQVIPTPDR